LSRGGLPTRDYANLRNRSRFVTPLTVGADPTTGNVVDGNHFPCVPAIEAIVFVALFIDRSAEE
jgi:hypothetical protein